MVFFRQIDLDFWRFFFMVKYGKCGYNFFPYMDATRDRELYEKNPVTWGFEEAHFVEGIPIN